MPRPKLCRCSFLSHVGAPPQALQMFVPLPCGCPVLALLGRAANAPASLANLTERVPRPKLCRCSFLSHVGAPSWLC